jgi:hypothetical protein
MQNKKATSQTIRVRMRVGEHSFYGEGSAEAVHASLREFSRLIGKEELPPPAPAPPVVELTEPVAEEAPVIPPIQRVARADGKRVSLLARTDSPNNAALAVMLAHGELRGIQMLSGADIMNGLIDSGHDIERVDYILKKHAAVGDVVVSGRYRMKRYRLTTDGRIKAQKIAQALADSLPKEEEAGGSR